MSKELDYKIMQADIKFLIETLAPASDPNEVVPHLSRMFYATGSYDGDIELATKIKSMCDRYDIEIEEIEEDFADD